MSWEEAAQSDVLKDDYGFKELGEIVYSASGYLRLTCQVPTEPCVYAIRVQRRQFIETEDVVYIGKAGNLHARFKHHLYPVHAGSKDSRIQTLIWDELQKAARLWLLSARPTTKWHGQPVSIHDAVERLLIPTFGPEWNLRLKDRMYWARREAASNRLRIASEDGRRA